MLSKNAYLLLALPLLLLACQSVQVDITHMRAAENSIPGDVRQIAILPYEYGDELNPQFGYVKDRVPDEVAAKITGWGTYGVVERQKLQTLVKEGMIQKGSILDEEDIEEVGRIAEAQAIVLGKVNTVQIEDRLTKKQVEMESNAPKDPDVPPPPPQIIECDYRILRVTVGITSEMLHVTDKKKIVTDSYSYTYDSERDPAVVNPHGIFTSKDASFYQNQVGRVPSVSSIVDQIAQNCAEQFLRKISAHPVNYRIALKSGSSAAMEQGLEWAKQRQYQSAVNEFMKATSDPDDKAAAWYNIGVCYEALKNLQEALKAYGQSDAIAPSGDAKQGIARIRQYYPSL